jgi:hypothetical protein
MDELDKASEQEQIARDKAIANIRNKQPKTLAVGSCLQCDCVLDGDNRWCSPTCRDDWQKWNPEA